ncbi:MAG: TRAP transporter large permease [Synergistaceae bacterium]|jgi:C4-dicarboxylate transporter DctM subunit|nr:TRAP transporter large permease [Synergistaceae bacterium]
MTLVLFVSLVTLFALSVPIAIAIGASTFIALLFASSIPPVVLAQKMFTAMDSFPLMAVPFFILAGALMEGGGISRRLIHLANTFVGHFAGGLAFVAIVASMFFGAISGAAAACVAAIGSVIIPEMTARGYGRPYTAAVQATAGTLGVMIPPSIPMIIYCVMTNVSVGALFMGGFVPGVLVGASLMFVAWYIARRQGYKGERRFTWAERVRALKDAFWALLMPLIILGGIYGGVFTPTEAAVVAVVYGLFVGFFVYKELRLSRMRAVLVNTAVSTATILFIIATSSAFSWVITSQRIPQMVAKGMLSLSSSRVAVLLMINVLLLFIGTFMETVASIIILTPVLLPVLNTLGVDLLHFGVVIVVNLAIGMVTPPLGVCLFVSCGISKISLEDISRAAFPFIGVMILDVLILTYLPVLSYGLPKLVGLY